MRDVDPQDNNVWLEAADRAARVFPYFFIAYIITQVVGLFYNSLDKYLNLIGFTSAIIFLGIISLFSPEFQAGGLKFFIDKLAYSARWAWANRYRSFGVVAFIIFCASWGAGVTELLVAAFGAITALFHLDSRISGGLGLAGLVLCPLLLFFHLDSLAEVVAVYAYFFLVIMVTAEITYPKSSSNPQAE